MNLVAAESLAPGSIPGDTGIDSGATKVDSGAKRIDPGNTRVDFDSTRSGQGPAGESDTVVSQGVGDTTVWPGSATHFAAPG